MTVTVQSQFLSASGLRFHFVCSDEVVSVLGYRLQLKCMSLCAQCLLGVTVLFFNLFNDDSLTAKLTLTTFLCPKWE
jgi:hypothetical protein